MTHWLVSYMHGVVLGHIHQIEHILNPIELTKRGIVFERNHELIVIS